MFLAGKLDSCWLPASQEACWGSLHSATYFLLVQALRNNETLPLVFFNVTIKGRPVGVIEMVLFSDISPRSAENFR